MTTANLVAALGSYGGAFAVGALANMLPLLSIDVFRVALALAGQLVGKLPICAASRGIQRRVLDLCARGKSDACRSAHQVSRQRLTPDHHERDRVQDVNRHVGLRSTDYNRRANSRVRT
jgi:hypothetical protein